MPAADERRRLGQHFTPPDLVELLVAACVRGPADRVLDAGCGPGTFLRQALARGLRPERACGVECDPALFRRAAADPALRGVRLLLRDFFALEPFEVDAVIGNPPYTRREALVDIEGPARALDAYPGLRLSRRAPLYVYFLLHAARFLRPGGRLGLVLPSGWLASDYGADLQGWLLARFSRITVVEPEAEPWFHGPSVNTCLLVARRGAGDDPVRFVRPRRPVAELRPAGRFWEQVDCGGGGGVRVTPIARSAVGRNWSLHLRAPDVYFRLLQLAAGRLVPLGELAEVRFAVKTGANAFFCLGPAEAEAAGIAPRYLKPLIHSLREAPAIRVRQARRLLFVCPDGGAAEHIRRGEAAGYHLRPTCAARRPWYDVKWRQPWPLLYPERSGERFLVLWNEAGAAVNKNLYELRPRDPRLTLPLCALLNSTWTRLGNELGGRVLVGNQDVVDTDVHAVERILVPDLRLAEAGRLRRLERALRGLWERPILPIASELAAGGRAALDHAALTLLGIDDPQVAAELQAATLALVRSRLRKGEGVGGAAYPDRARERFGRGDRR